MRTGQEMRLKSWDWMEVHDHGLKPRSADFYGALPWRRPLAVPPSFQFSRSFRGRNLPGEDQELLRGGWKSLTAEVGDHDLANSDRISHIFEMLHVFSSGGSTNAFRRIQSQPSYGARLVDA